MAANTVAEREKVENPGPQTQHAGGESSHQLRRAVGPWGSFTWGYADVGADVYVALGLVMAAAQGATNVAFLFAGLIYVCVGLAYTELAAAYPFAGGGQFYVLRGLGDLAGFVAGWAVLLDFTVDIALFALASAGYISFFFPVLQRTVELNVFGLVFPETQPLLMRLKTDVLDVFEAVTEDKLDRITLQWDPRPAVCVVMASGGYPASYESGKPISGLDAAAAMDDVVVFHAGTRKVGSNIVTAGGRVLGVTALGETVAAAQKRAYEACAKISWDGAYYRRDIGAKALK